MSNIKIKAFLSTILLLTVAFFATAQTDEKTQVETMTIFGTFTPTIRLTPKIEENPDANNYTVKPPAIDFEMKTEAIHSVENSELLAPEQLPKEKTEKYPHNYLILGFGNYTTPYGEFYANMSPMDNHAFGIHLKHLSSQGGIKDYADNAFSHNLGDLYYKFSGQSFILKADVFLKRDVVHYYGFKPTDLFDPPSDSIKQRYFLGGANISLGSNDVDPVAFSYLVNLKYSNFSDRFENKEHIFSIDADMKKGFFIFDTRTPQKAGAKINFAYFNNNILTEDKTFSLAENDVLFGIQPYFECDWSEYRAKIGVDVGMTRNEEETKIYIHPIVETSIKVIQNRLYLFARLGGSIERNSFLSLAEQNPFIAPGCYFSNFSNKKFTAAGGFSAMITKGFDMKIGGEYADIENMPFFMSRPDALTRNFFTRYDRMKQLDLFLESNYTYSNKLSFALGLHYYVNQTDSLEYAYYQPSFKMMLAGKYRPIERLSFGAEFYFYSKMWAPDPYSSENLTGFENVQLPMCYDLNLSAEYRIWKALYLFLQANNIFAQNYEHFLNYPAQGFNILGGARFRF